MRREASLELWKSLYKAAVRLMELAPWENFWDTDLVAIQLKDRRERVYEHYRPGSCRLRSDDV